MSVKKNFTAQNELNTAVVHADREQTEQKRKVRGRNGAFSNGWSYIEIFREAKKFNHRSDFKYNSKCAYTAAQSRGILWYVCKHMRAKPKVIKWNFLACQSEAKKYKTRRDFEFNSGSAYTIARRKGWLQCICRHMPERQVKYSVDNISKVASKYKTRNAFMKGGNAHYQAARRLGVLDEVCTHMDFACMPPGYWIKERCKNEASKYKTKIDYKTKSQSSYEAARVAGFLDEICSHMEMIRPKSDIVYIWKIESPVATSGSFKLGVTSSSQKYMDRAKSCARDLGVSVGWYREFYVGDCALSVEKIILGFGEKVNQFNGSGSTEIRSLSPTELKQILEIMKNARSIQ